MTISNANSHFLTRLSLVLGTAAAILPPASSFGDTYQILGGGVIAGKTLGDVKSDTVRMKTSEGVEIEMARTKVRSIRTSGPLEAEYEKKAASKDDSIESHRELSSQTYEQQRSLAEAHFERISELDPMDKVNWSKLGYREDEFGRWRRGDSIQAGLGLVKAYSGKGWTTPQARAIEEVEQKQRKAKAELEREIDRSVKNLNKPGAAGVEASTFLNTLDNPLAIDDIYKRLLKEVDRGGNGQLYFTILARMPGTSASLKFIELAMNSSNQNIVDQCNELLLRSEASRELAMQGYLSVLSSGDKKMDPSRKDRAASNIQVVGDERCIPTLTLCLRSKISISIQSGGGTNFSSDGGISQSTPRTTNLEKQYEHQPVLSALQEFTGENFGFDTLAWQYWYSRAYSDRNLNLRRDE